MKKSSLYYTLPTLRKVRRLMRRACQKYAIQMIASRSYITLRDSHGSNIMKTRRWRNRLMTSQS